MALRVLLPRPLRVLASIAALRGIEVVNRPGLACPACPEATEEQSKRRLKP